MSYLLLIPAIYLIVCVFLIVTGDHSGEYLKKMSTSDLEELEHEMFESEFIDSSDEQVLRELSRRGKRLKLSEF